MNIRKPSFRTLVVIILMLLHELSTTQAAAILARTIGRRKHQWQKKQRGTFLTLRRPTSDRVSLWFQNVRRGVLDFNHDSIGMTNPGLSSTGNESSAVSAKADNVTFAWFPPCSCYDSSWRVLRYRRRIGRGESCYNRVRDAVLGWEFGNTNNSSKGILRVHAANKSKDFGGRTSRIRHTTSMGNDGIQTSDSCNHDLTLTKDVERNVIQVWSGPHASRRLVTYSAASASRSTKGSNRQLFPQLYAVNPVVVVYDLVDERGPGATYTSTAYATLKGHWLSGEERVTVAHRDGNGKGEGHVDVEILSYSRPAPTRWGKLVWPLIGRMQNNFFESQLDAFEQVAR